MQYIYKFYNNQNECLYVGKTNSLKTRFSQHKQDKSWWNEISKIEYAQLPENREFMVDLYEIYYINKLNTKYNAKDTKIVYSRNDYPELNFIEYVVKSKKSNKKSKKI